MARDVGDCCRRLDGGLTKKVQKKLGVLAFPLKQSTLDCLGSPRQGVRAYPLAALSCGIEP